MKIDWYTKAVLTVIAIGVGFLVFEQKPVKEAHAFMGGGEMIAADSSGVYYLKDGKIRYCVGTRDNPPFCSPWSK